MNKAIGKMLGSRNIKIHPLFLSVVGFITFMAGLQCSSSTRRIMHDIYHTLDMTRMS
ncbi:hypothetical protein LCY76_12080 [Fictibacillus sp. KIGAM418]|uniref:Uncharacterized protein n=1 Tax=Fictibacillus marinisediminis TaxID=2878389 RepID=A0A9X1XDC5_9BACL|nr:hypothetical protein [Fictibacillus marinisediminis]MCK6257333.1 hypothetical protein [Fictibacillus marinisediminis]